MGKTKNHHILCIWMKIIYMDEQCLKNYLQMNLNGKNTSKLDEKFIKIYDEESDKVYMLQCPKKLFNIHKDLSLLPEKIKVKKFHKLLYNLYDRNNYVAQIRTLKQALNDGLILKKRISNSISSYRMA